MQVVGALVAVLCMVSCTKSEETALLLTVDFEKTLRLDQLSVALGEREGQIPSSPSAKAIAPGTSFLVVLPDELGDTNQDVLVNGLWSGKAVAGGEVSDVWLPRGEMTQAHVTLTEGAESEAEAEAESEAECEGKGEVKACEWVGSDVGAAFPMLALTPTSIAVDDTGGVHIAYAEGGDPIPYHYVYSDEAGFREDRDFSDSSVDSAGRVALATQGDVVHAALNTSDDTMYALKSRKRKIPDGSWTGEDVVSGKGGVPTGSVDLVVGGDGAPHVSWYQASAEYYARRIGASWEVETVPGSWWHGSLAIGQDGVIHVAGSSGFLGYRSCSRGLASSWSCEELAPDYSAPEAAIDIAASGDDRIHVVFSGDERHPVYRFRSDGSWSKPLQVNDDAIHSLGGVSVAAGCNVVHLLYVHADNYFDYSLRYTSYAGDGFAEPTTFEEGAGIIGVSLAVDRQGGLHASYVRANATDGSGQLRYAHCP